MRAIVENIFWRGLTEKDTARVLGISDRTVRNHLRRAYIQLGERLATP
jgi:DNA-binding CsgD family transcriptional regulator